MYSGILYSSMFDGIEITLTKNLYEKTDSKKSWRKKPITTITEKISAQEYINCISWKSDRCEKGYTYAGYIPVKITSVSPDKMKKWEFTFSFRLVH